LTGAPGHGPWRYTLLPVVPSRLHPCGRSAAVRFPDCPLGRHGGTRCRMSFSPRMRG